jgi:hypothetical protein
MAGQGPAPKDQEKRRRRNKSADVETLPAEGYQGEYPALAQGYTLVIDSEEGPTELWVEYLPATHEWYEEWARSPMAVRFTAVDWGRLRRIVAPLADKYHRRPTTSIATELRLQESLLGATVMDRQRMRLRVESSEGGKTAETVSQGRFGHLSVVLDDAAESA